LIAFTALALPLGLSFSSGKNPIERLGGGGSGGRAAPSDQTVSHLLPKTLRAIMKPGLRREAVFQKNAAQIYAYSVDPNNPDRLIREDELGIKTKGYFLGSMFCPELPR